MRLLLDSNAYLWAIMRPTELSSAARRAIENPDNERFVSVVSLWELAIKASIGKLELPDDFASGVEHLEASLLPLAVQHIERLRVLPLHHRDPFDRALVAQALTNNLTIVTRDRRFDAYGVPLLTA